MDPVPLTPHKNQPLLRRFRHAGNGIRIALQESSFRVELLAATVAEGTLMWMRPPLVWDVLITLMVILVLSAELFNTALEWTLDGLHPEHARFVQHAKDCAAAAVLLLSLASLLLYAALWLAWATPA